MNVYSPAHAADAPLPYQKLNIRAKKTVLPCSSTVHSMKKKTEKKTPKVDERHTLNIKLPPFLL